MNEALRKRLRDLRLSGPAQSLDVRLQELVGDVPAATAILDRFLQHTEIIHITGRSYRLKNRTPAKAAVDKQED